MESHDQQEAAPEPTRFGRRALSALGVAGLAAAGTAALARPAHADPRAAASATTVTDVGKLRQAPGSATGDLALLLGYAEARPGVGGGLLYWDAGATEPDNGGTVFAVAGAAKGRWKRFVAGEVEAAWFGVGSDDGDQSRRIQDAVDALPDGGKINFGPGVFRIEQTIVVTLVPITFVGAGMGDYREPKTLVEADLGTQLLIKTPDTDAFLLRGVRGGGFRDLQLRGDIDPEDERPLLKGGAFVRTERHPDVDTINNYFVSFTGCRFKEGYHGIVLQGCNTIRFQHCVWNGFRGDQVILLNGVGDTHRADPVEFVQCAISAGTKNPDTDNVVIDGLGGSIKFVETAILFGRHGIWLRNTTPDTESLPKFLYFEAGGFENGHGYPVLLEAGADAKFANCYISQDGFTDNVRITDGFAGSAMFSGVIVRGAGRHGFDLDAPVITITGSVIGNNGRAAHPKYGRTITAAAAVDGGVRATLDAPHGWEDGDSVTVQEATGTGLNGRWPITVIDADEIELLGADLAGYTGGGVIIRHGSGVNLRSRASRVVITGNVIGGLPEGTNRQDYGIVSGAADVLVSDNDLSHNHGGPYRLTGGAGVLSRFLHNKGIVAYDGYLTLHLPAAVADGDHDLGELLYLHRQRLRVLAVIRRTAAGTCRVRLTADGEPLGGADLEATPETGAANLSEPILIDGLSAPRRLRLRIAGAAAAQGLEVQFAYQLVG